MNNVIWSLALSCLLAPPVEKSDDATTHLYVRTSPAGAEIVLDGKSIGKSPGLFPVESGARRLVIELDGHVAEDQKITIRDGRVTRIELTLKPRPEASPEADAMFRRIKIGKKVADFPEPVDLSTPESAWAAYHQASSSQDAQGVVDLSWESVPPQVMKQSMEKFWANGDPKDMAAYNKAQLEAELIEVVVYRDRLAATISRLEFPRGVGQHPFSKRTFGLIDGKWKNLGEERCPSLEAAVKMFTQKAERHWSSYKAAAGQQEGVRAWQRHQAALAGKAEDPLAPEFPLAVIIGPRISKKVTDFPEAIDLSTPESAWAAYHRASGRQDAQGVVDLSWVRIDPREMERFWNTGNQDDMAAYNKAQLDAELLQVIVYGDKLAATISRLEFPPGAVRRPFSQRTFGLIDGSGRTWERIAVRVSTPRRRTSFRKGRPSGDDMRRSGRNCRRPNRPRLRRGINRPTHCHTNCCPVAAGNARSERKSLISPKRSTFPTPSRPVPPSIEPVPGWMPRQSWICLESRSVMKT